jgi:Rab-GTPase-TBC domain
MINLESPSLTSLVLTKLASSHLRDALRKDRIMIDTALAHAFMPLLESVDWELFMHLQRHGMTLPTFCRQWVACWFSQDVPDVDVASRLLDAFLVGHPLLPLYASVALLTSLRTQILQCNSHLSTLYSLLRGLPVQNLYEEESRMFKAENVLATALNYMRTTPPDALIKLISSKSNASLVLDTIAMFRAPPAWCFEPKAPNDYVLLKRAQDLRDRSVPGDEDENELHCQCSSVTAATLPSPVRYPLSFAAIGCVKKPPHTRKRSLTMRIFCVVILTSVLAAILRTTTLSLRSSTERTARKDVEIRHPSSAFSSVSRKKAVPSNFFTARRADGNKLPSNGPVMPLKQVMTIPQTPSSGLLAISVPAHSPSVVSRRKETDTQSPTFFNSRSWLATIVSAVEAASASVYLYQTFTPASSSHTSTRDRDWSKNG